MTKRTEREHTTADCGAFCGPDLSLAALRISPRRPGAHSARADECADTFFYQWLQRAREKGGPQDASMTARNSGIGRKKVRSDRSHKQKAGPGWQTGQQAKAVKAGAPAPPPAPAAPRRQHGASRAWQPAVPREPSTKPAAVNARKNGVSKPTRSEPFESTSFS